MIAFALLLALGASAPAGNPSQHWAKPEEHGGAPARGAQQSAAPGTPTPEKKGSKSSNGGTNNGSAQHNDEGAPKWTDDAMAFSAIGSFFLTFVLAVSTVLLWRETKRLAVGGENQHGTLKDSLESAKSAAEAAQRAAVAAISAQRPWVKPAIEIETFEIFANSIQAELMVTLINVGSTPAVYTYVHSLLCPDAGNIDTARALTLCRGAIDSYEAQRKIGRTLFPQDPRRQSVAITLSNHDLLSVGLDPTRDGKCIPMLIVGIVSYKFSGGSGETPFAYRVFYLPTKNAMLMDIPLVEGSIPKALLVKADWSAGEAAN